MFDLLLITSWSVWIGKFHEIFVELFSVTCAGSCWYHGMYFLKNPCSSSKRTWMHLPTLSWLLILLCRWKNITTRYDVVDGFFFDTGVPHVSSSSTLKTCFLMCLMEIACFWMAIFVDYVDLSWVEDLIHWLDHSLSTWGWWRYVENYPCTFFLLSSTASLLMHADLMVNFCGNFLMAVVIMANFVTILGAI